MGPPRWTYLARATVGGKLIRQRLHTATYSVAVLRLIGVLEGNRGRVEIREATRSDPVTFREAADVRLLTPRQRQDWAAGFAELGGRFSRDCANLVECPAYD